MTTKTKILIGILVVLVSAGGILAWKYKWTLEYKISPIRILQKSQCYKINKEFYSRFENLDRRCQSDGDCRIASLGMGICINKDEDIKGIKKLEEIWKDRCFQLEGIPSLYPIPSGLQVYECKCKNNTCKEIRLKEILGPNKVTITTDKIEYEVGETVRITLRNGLDKSIFGGFGHCGGLPFWGLQKFDNGDWRDLDFSLPYSEKGKEVCDLILCEREEPAELKSGLTIEDSWHLTSICEWPEKPVGVPKTEPKPIEEGTYRVRLIYGLNRREFDLLEINTIYSNEFGIKEKTAAEKDPRCLMPKPTEIGGCKILVGFYYNPASNDCLPIGGCEVEGEIPFTGIQRQECIQLCVEK